jgi:hypothetical protein
MEALLQVELLTTQVETAVLEAVAQRVRVAPEVMAHLIPMVLVLIPHTPQTTGCPQVVVAVALLVTSAKVAAG